MKILFRFILAFTMLPVTFPTYAQQASGYILFGKRLNGPHPLAACTKQGICKLSSQTAPNPEGIPVTFYSTLIEGSDHIYNITFTIDPQQLPEDQKVYFNKGSNSYRFRSDFTFPDWLMKALGFKDYKPIHLRKFWNFGKQFDITQPGKQTAILCGFKTKKNQAIVEGKKTKGKVLRVARVKRIINS